MSTFDDWNSLAHHGIKGQKWGVRRFQNPDGTLTEAGKKHNAKQLEKAYKKGDTRKVRKSQAYRTAVANTYEERLAAKKANDAFGKMEDDFYNNRHLLNKYQKKSAKEDAKRAGVSYEEMLTAYRKGDLDQGRSFEKYIRSDDKARQRYQQLAGQAKSANEALRNKARSEVDSLLGKYGDRLISHNMSYTSNMGTFKQRTSSFSYSISVGEHLVNNILDAEDDLKRKRR